MKDYSYFIPGYTGFCPELREHFGQTYGHATRRIIQEKPHLRERLAPVFYDYRRQRLTKMGYGKYFEYEKDKYDHLKDKRHAHFVDVDKVRMRKDYEDGDKKRKTVHEHMYPRYVFVESYSENAPATCTPQDRGDAHHIHYPFTVMPCSHLREYPEDFFVKKDYKDYKMRMEPRVKLHRPGGEMLRNTSHIPEYAPEMWTIQERGDAFHVHYPFIAMPCSHLREYPEDFSVRKESKDYKMRKVPKVKPHREGGVIPKYTGHIPGMQFSFGESYGPASYRLLRRHNDGMKQSKRKS